MQLAISQPELVNKLIIASAFYKKSGAIKGFFENMKNATIADMPLIYKEAYLKINHDSAGLQRMFNRDWTRMMEFTDWTDDEIGSIHAPSLIIAGDNDVVTKEHAVEMAHKIRNSQLLIVPGNHGSYIGEAFAAQPGSKMPVLTVSVVEEFLGR